MAGSKHNFMSICTGPARGGQDPGRQMWLTPSLAGGLGAFPCAKMTALKMSQRLMSDKPSSEFCVNFDVKKKKFRARVTCVHPTKSPWCAHHLRKACSGSAQCVPLPPINCPFGCKTLAQPRVELASSPDQLIGGRGGSCSGQ